MRIAIASEYPIRRLAVFAGHNEKVHVSDLGGCSDMDCGESLLIFVEGAGAGAPSGFISRGSIPPPSEPITRFPQRAPDVKA